MKFWHVLLLAFILFICYPIAQGTNNAALVATIIFMPGIVVLYLMPTIVAYVNGHRQKVSIAVVDVLLGWTLIGWVAALAWAFTAKPEVEAEITRMPERAREPPAPQPASDTKKCPFCAEEIKAAAIKCKHCGSDLSNAPA